MTLFDCILYCLNQFRVWAEAGEAGIDGDIELRHDGLEHGLVLFLTGLMVVPGDDQLTERAELCTLIINTTLVFEEQEFTFEGVSYEIPLEACLLSKKLTENYILLKNLEPEEALSLLMNR